jgi:DNA-binding CsgD family transcriptional regulator
MNREYYFNTLTNTALACQSKTTQQCGTPKTSSHQESHLNDKELLILKLMCEEKSTREIADFVDLSPRTVEAIRGQTKSKNRR